MMHKQFPVLLVITILICLILQTSAVQSYSAHKKAVNADTISNKLENKTEKEDPLPIVSESVEHTTALPETTAFQEITVESTTEVVTETTTEITTTITTETQAPVIVDTTPVTEYVPANTDPNFFDNSLFIGDSRTVGLQLYNNMGQAIFLATVGLSTVGVFYESVNVPGYGNCNLDKILTIKPFDRIYISLGLNEIGCDPNAILGRYSNLINKIRLQQPDATIILMANLHAVKSRSDSDPTFSNTRINTLNQGMASLCDGSYIRYIDPNEIFDDENGALSRQYASDDFHLQVSGYIQWANWIKDN